MTEHKIWQRRTALNKVTALKADAERHGLPMSDQRAAKAAAGYVDVTPEQVLKWMKEAGR